MFQPLSKPIIVFSPILSAASGVSFASDHDTATIFKTAVFSAEYFRIYDSLLSMWPEKPDQVDIETSFGVTHINVNGPQDAPPLLLLPGFAANSTAWFANIGPLAKRFRVYAIDTNGQPGRSIPSKVLTASTTSEWLLELMDKAPLGRCNLAGISLGGWIALDFAIKHPTRVNRVVLLDPAASFAPMSASFVFHSLIPIMIYPTRNGLIKYFRWLTRGKATNSEWGELMVQGILNCKPQPPVRATPFSDSQLSGCLAPTLLLVGEKSLIYDPEKAVQRAARFMPHVSTEILADASHGLNYEQPDLVNSKLIAFLEKQE
jgi:pimeloyl-ACP methyl ester carboxylesterase